MESLLDRGTLRSGDLRRALAGQGNHFAETGLDDFGLALGYWQHRPHSNPLEMRVARDPILLACRNCHVTFLLSAAIVARLDEGVRATPNCCEDVARSCYMHQKRAMPV